MFKFFLHSAFRNLRKNKTYGFLNIFGLAIGIACACLIFLWVEDERGFDGANVNKSRLYSVQVNMNYAGRIFTMGSTPRPMAASLKAEIPGIANASRISDEDQNLLFTIAGKSFYAGGRYTDLSLFNMFTLPFVQGNPKSAFEQLYSIVITEKAMKKFFGDDQNVIGRTVRVNNKQDYTVTGVLKDLPANSTLQFDWLAPFEIEVQQQNDHGIAWNSYGPITYVELDANADPAAVTKQLKDFIHRKEPRQKNEALLFPMKDWRLYGEFENGRQTGSGRIKQVQMLSAIAWIILFIACINFMNLATSNSQKRSREVGVRKMLGAGKKGLIAQFVGETVCMSLLATAAAIILITLALPAFNILMQKQLSLSLSSPVHMIALLFIAIICGLVAGSYPALYLSSFNTTLILKGLKRKTGSAALIRKGLVVVQFAVSVVFIISTIIVYMQIQHAKNRNLGFDKKNLIEIDMQHDISKIFPLIKQDLLLTGLIENAAMSDHATIYGGNTDGSFKWQGKPPDNKVDIAFRNVSPEFISTSGMQIIEGKDFRANGSSESSNIIINQSFAKIMGNESAVGKIIQSPRRGVAGSYTNLTVVGIVNDYLYGNMYGNPGPVLFFCRPSEDANLVYVRTKRESNPEQTLAKIGEVMKKDNPSYPLEYKFVDDQFNQMFFNELLISKVSGIFAALAIIISCLGLFGLAAYTAGQRTKEIGIRKVLGASSTSLASLLSKDFLQLVCVSCVVAFPVAWWAMHSWLENYEYRIMISWWVFLIAGTIAVLIALLTVSFQAIKAALANPVKSLRME